MPKPEKYDNPAERQQAWTRLHSNPDFVQFFLAYYVTEKIETMEQRIIMDVTPDGLEAARAFRNALVELRRESSPANFTTPK
jgi:hypothetical protein